MAKYIELIDKYKVVHSDDDDTPTSYTWVDNTGEIVRCGECKWYSIYEAKKDGTPDKRHSPSVCLREIYAKRRDPDWFCADGEREVQK